MGGAWPVVRNLLKALLLFAALCAIFCGLGWALGGYRLILLFGAAAVLIAAAVYGYGDRFVLGMLGGRELQLAEAPGLHVTVSRLAAKAGVPAPKLQLIPDGHPRAFAIGRGPTGATIAVSSGLLAALPPAELEGVLAHELAHIRSRDVLTQQAAVVLAATLIELSRVGGLLQRALLFVLGPVASACVHLLLSPKRELAADRAAAWLCESPHGLADALIRLEQAVELVEFSASPATEPLYTINPFLEEGLAALFVTHPRPAERVQRLRELDPMWRDKLRAA
jgi:heat shock protein HtpX